MRFASCSDTPLVPASELPARLAALPQWRLAADGKSIEKAFVARNFVAGGSSRFLRHAAPR
jgi:pterin-4a-carbinolamine dehydratase